MATAVTSSQTAGIAAAVLITFVVVFQLALVLGLPLGDAVLGGTTPTRDGVLVSRAEVLGIPLLGGEALAGRRGHLLHSWR